MQSQEAIVTDSIRSAAERIRQAHATRVPCAPIRDLIGAADVAAAYAVQDINTRHWMASGRRIVGRKIGLTSKAVQAQLGVDQPDFGILFDDMMSSDGAPISFDSLMQPKVETEVALVLEKPLNREHHEIEDIAAATAYVVPAIEIVGSRIANWDIKLADTIADNASSGRFVLGLSAKRKVAGLDLVNCGMTMTRKGEQVSVGKGAACLGNPLLAAAWLADTMVKYGRPLQAGDILMTGALGPMVAVKPRDEFEANIEGLGSIRALFAEG
jgi:2-keto-4-pentenoate hydratase